MNVITWIGVALGLVAKWQMATHRHQAIRVLLVSTVVYVLWALYREDWQNFVLNVISCVFMLRTMIIWKGKNDV